MKRFAAITFGLIVVYLLIRNSAIYTRIVTKSTQVFRQGLGIVTGA